MRHIPNVLTSLRILMVGAFAYFFASGQYLFCLITIVVAFFTDLLDGYLARRNNWISNLGKILDPFADKLFIITAIVCFFFGGWLMPSWGGTWMPLLVLILVVVKEVAMIVGGLFLLKKEVVVYSDWFGKSAAGLFTAGIVLMFLRELFIPVIGDYALYVLLLSIALTYVAMVHYGCLNVLNRTKREKV